jgi:hypothetical protein
LVTTVHAFKQVDVVHEGISRAELNALFEQAFRLRLT